MATQLNRDLENRETQQTSLFDLIFRDSEGKIVIAQMPNLPILVGLSATLLHVLLPVSQLQTAFGLIAFGALFTWAWLEIFEGVNYFRRGLGLVSLVGLMVLVLKMGGV